ncbi:MAG: hypothetical protein ABFS35_04590 [Bacteroidota bacterium]
MNKFLFISFCVILLIIPKLSFADGGLVAFYKLGTIDGTIDSVKNEIYTLLKKDSFKIIGEYHPAKDENLLVITFTNKELLDICKQVPERGLMAAVMRVGLISINGQVEISLLNPEYLFYAYLRDDMKKFEIRLNQISMNIKIALFPISNGFVPYITSSLSERELKEFRFSVRNPSFDEPVLVKRFSNFDQAVNKIRENLQARREGSIKVYELIDKERKIAVFGVGLLDRRKGEAVFLPKLGESHLAALPYELVINDNSANILHGKFRFPLYWSDLTMAEYRRIYKSPRDVEELMKALTR